MSQTEGDPETLVADIIRHGNAFAATREKQFVPALCVWLSGERWTDELPTAAPAKTTAAAKNLAAYEQAFRPFRSPSQRAAQTLAAGQRVTANLAVVDQLAAMDAAEAGEFPPGHIPTNAEWDALVFGGKTAGTPVPPTVLELTAGQCREHPGYPLTNGACDKCQQIRRESLGAA